MRSSSLQQARYTVVAVVNPCLRQVRAPERLRIVVIAFNLSLINPSIIDDQCISPRISVMMRDEIYRSSMIKGLNSRHVDSKNHSLDITKVLLATCTA